MTLLIVSNQRYLVGFKLFLYVDKIIFYVKSRIEIVIHLLFNPTTSFYKITYKKIISS